MADSIGASRLRGLVIWRFGLQQSAKPCGGTGGGAGRSASRHCREVRVELELLTLFKEREVPARHPWGVSGRPGSAAVASA